MRNRLKSFFLCLLIVSLPMQGIAGVARFGCGMVHQPAAQNTEAHGMEHDMSHAPGETAAQDTASPDDDCEETGEHGRSGCGTCPSCSIGANAPPPVLTISAVEEAVIGRQQFISSSFIGHIPARIERPPRAV
jgi:hypothetical protein